MSHTLRRRICTANTARLLWATFVISILADLVWYDAAGRGVKSWLEPQPILSAVALILGLIVLSWQLEKQHQNTLEANRRQSQDRLKLELYNKIAERIEATSIPLMELGLLPTAFIGELIVRKSASLDRTTAPASRYFPKLPETQQAAVRSVTALMSALERRTRL